MKFQSFYRKAAALTFAFILMSFNASYAITPANDYSFKVTNKTNTVIKKLLASEDGKKYGYFDIGKGIGVGKTITLVWDKSTDNGNCEQYFKAVFADGEESEAVTFDFCEDDLELVFD
jgi:hypothetical protein